MGEFEIEELAERGRFVREDQPGLPRIVLCGSEVNMSLNQSRIDQMNTVVTDNDTTPVIACVRSAAELSALAAEWRELYVRINADNVFLSHSWMSTWHRHFGKDSQLFVLTARRSDGQLVGLAPLSIGTLLPFLRHLSPTEALGVLLECGQFG